MTFKFLFKVCLSLTKLIMSSLKDFHFFMSTSSEKNNKSRNFVILINRKYSEAVVQSCSVKKVLLKISQNPQENTCARDSFLIKSQNTSGGCF